LALRGVSAHSLKTSPPIYAIKKFLLKIYYLPEICERFLG